MERNTTDKVLTKWTSPSVTEIRVSAEVTAYVAVMGGAK
ncbi:pyrroloquinoline quinone precursor peptide PqqA [Rhodococcoides trifolii]|nr:pyrroloquinoline quinone precursor peptide PqqA [Rhodococcus trifolii]